MRFHFIGICGAGMSAVAKLLIENGHTVTGSDALFYPPVSDYLKAHHIPCLTPYAKENIPEGVDFIVIGKHAKLVPEENEEVAVAFSSGAKVISFPEALATLTETRERVVVAGSYGKSSCTSLIAWCLESNGIDAGYFIGAVPQTPPTNAHVGTDPVFILEGDEYPSSNWDSTSKFLHYHPKHVLLTALAHDHVNVFATHNDYLAPYEALLEQVEDDGVILACLDDETIRTRAGDMTTHTIVTYGITPDADWHAARIVYGMTTSFDLMHHNKLVASCTTTLLGAHNIQNIVGSVALLLEMKKITVEQAVQAVSTCKGIVRRLDKKSEHTRIPIYEGFGSSIDKARSAIDAMKLHFKEKRLVVIFEPHTFSWRNRQALPWYDTVFHDVDHVFIYKPPEHGSETHEQLSLDEIVERVRSSGITVTPFKTKDEGIAALLDMVQLNDVILILSSGGMDGLIPETVLALETTFPA